MAPSTVDLHQQDDQDTTMVDAEDSTLSKVELGTKNDGTQTASGFYLRWSRLAKEVEISSNAAGLMGNASISASFHRPKSKGSPAGTAGTKKVILDCVSGCAAPGELLCCMGPSGSGKTSLMNVLSGRASYQSGTISINGEPITSTTTMKRLMAKVAYVKQQDVFFEHLSVRDQLTYTALLRLPKSTSTEEKHDEVDRILGLLRLDKVADSAIYLLSGGEKKRVNIGTELLTNPSLLLLDEPTSGLDSTSAVSLISMLQELARTGNKTVITTIHQPSSALFRSFDRLLLLSEGHVVYFGTPVESLAYLDERGFDCPNGYNAADHWMDLLVKDRSSGNSNNQEEVQPDGKGGAVVPPAGELKRRRMDQSNMLVSPRVVLQKAWDNETVAQRMDLELKTKDDASDNDNNSKGELDLGKKYNTGWMTQYAVLTHRALKNARSAIFTPLNLIKSVAIGLVCGVLWFQTEYTEKNVFDIRSFFFFTPTYWVMEAMFEALGSFPSERAVILKERASGSYHLSAYFMAKATSDAPGRLVLPLLYMIIAYWMAGMDDRFWVFIGSTGCTLLSVLAGDAIGLLIGAIVYEMETAMAVATVLNLGLMLVGGFFLENVPAWIVWTKYLSPFKYAFDSSLQVIFDRPVPCDGSGSLGDLCAPTTAFGGPPSAVPGEAVLEAIGVQGSVAFNVGMLLLFCFLPRYGAYLALRMKKGGERS